MEQTPFPGVDREVFERVWRRVMPEDRADCPFTLPEADPPAESPAVPAAATGPAGTGTADRPSSGPWGEALRQYIDGEVEGWRQCQALARRLSGRSGRDLAAAAAGELRHAKRLSALYFLLSGVRYWPRSAPAVLRDPLPTALRERFWAFRQAAETYRAAALRAEDARLSEIFTQLADEESARLRPIREALEQL